MTSNSRVSGLNQWQRADRDNVFEARGQTLADSSAVQLSLTLSSLGISRIMDVVTRPFLAAGLLRPMLAEHFDQKAFPFPFLR